MFSSPPDASTRNNSTNPVNRFIHSILSYDSNIMLAAIISLLLVILFVLLLHVYAKWFLVQARQRSRRTVSVPQVLGARFHHFHSFTIETTFSISPTKGLESSVISSIPLFVYKLDEHEQGILVECSICLSAFEDEEMGRKLPRCSHAFHVDCIDMWLHSHLTCPICRCPVVSDDKTLELNSLLRDEVLDLDPEISETMLNEREMLDDQTSRLEIIIEVPNTQDDENGGKRNSISVCSTSSSSSMSSNGAVFIGDSVKRIMSRNRSECKVHPSESVYDVSDV